MIIPYLHDMINYHQTAETQSKIQKIQIFMHVNFLSSKDTGETRTIYVWSNNRKIMQGSATDDVIRELF